MKDWRTLGGKTVTVHASGIVYRGTVVEAGERMLMLRSEGGFLEIPWEQIARIEEGPSPGAGPGRSRPLPLPQGWG